MKQQHIDRALLISLACVANAVASVEFYTDRAAFEAAVSAHNSIVMDEQGVLLATEVAVAPSHEDPLPSPLSFDRASTGQSFDFRIAATIHEDFYYKDDKAARGLAPGDNIQGTENHDDWDITFTAGHKPFFFGVEIEDNDGSTGEKFCVYNTSDQLIDCYGDDGGESIPIGNFFAGVVSTEPIGRFFWDDEPNPPIADNIYIAELLFPLVAIPTVSEWGMVVMAVLVLTIGTLTFRAIVRRGSQRPT